MIGAVRAACGSDFAIMAGYNLILPVGEGFPHPIRPMDGKIAASQAPGFGTEGDEDVVRRLVV